MFMRVFICFKIGELTIHANVNDSTKKQKLMMQDKMGYHLTSLFE